MTVQVTNWESGLERLTDKPDIRQHMNGPFRIVRVVQALGRDVSSQVIAKQLARSGMSVGANVEEAQGAHSKKDFVRRMNMSPGAKVLYWLRLIADTGIMPRRRLTEITREAEEVVRILVSIVKTARRRSE